ncbi:MAG: hypothetical protein ACK559_41920, partial [bacterium]
VLSGPVALWLWCWKTRPPHWPEAPHPTLNWRAGANRQTGTAWPARFRKEPDCGSQWSAPWPMPANPQGRSAT